MPAKMMLTFSALLLATALSGNRAFSQGVRFPDIERRYDAVVLVADAHSGKLLGGCRISEAGERKYHPGSLFKLAIAVAALRSGRFDRSFRYTCRGKDTIAGAVRNCWRHDGHATIGFRDAIALSCNLYFRAVARRLSKEEIIQSARGIGMIPEGMNDAALREALDDDTLLGEAFLVTPLEMLKVAVGLASQGRTNAGGSLLGETYRPLYEGMRQCVRSGTGSGAWSSKIAIAGKTGTTDVQGTRSMKVGWFIGFAPANSPRYAVAVMYRHAHGFEAATVARKILEKLM